MKEQIERQGQSLFTKRARKFIGRTLRGRAFNMELSKINSTINLAIESARLHRNGQITKGDLRTLLDPFGLRSRDLSVRIPEESEMFNAQQAQDYIDNCDYPETVDELLLAVEVQNLIGAEHIPDMKILDAMCGPGRLGREFMALGANRVVFHDGDKIMTNHARSKAFQAAREGQKIDVITSPVESIPLPGNSFYLVICHNATHQLSSLERLRLTMEEFLRLAISGGFVFIADYQRANTPEFLEALEERLRWTKPKVLPLLVPTYTAAFSKKEFEEVLSSIQGIKTWSVTDAQPPVLSPSLQERVNQDPVKGHLMDYSPRSLRAIVQKE